MPTTYPRDLPAVPADRWDAEKLADRIERPDDGRAVAVADFALNATSPDQAEVRLLAYIEHDFEDELRKATAIATQELAQGRWRVSLRVPGEY
ncbi:hypothetical protein [Streptomyces niveus]|uniref:hypothetical protein n=1 Tax=Streptomyces niveus TaxID=193462 RepID=UPI00342E4024